MLGQQLAYCTNFAQLQGAGLAIANFLTKLSINLPWHPVDHPTLKPRTSTVDQEQELQEFQVTLRIAFTLSSPFWSLRSCENTGKALIDM